jgi:hypothetical protein
MPLGIATVILAQIGTAALNWWRGKQHSQHLQQLQRDYETTAQQEGITRAQEKAARLAAYQHTAEHDAHQNRLTAIHHSCFDAQTLDAYTAALTNWPLHAPPYVLAAASLPATSISERSEQASFPPTASVGAAQRSQLPLATRPAATPVRVGPCVSVPVRVSPCSLAPAATIALQCLLSRSNDDAFNRALFRELENTLAHRLDHHWHPLSTHPVLFHSGAWKETAKGGTAIVENIRCHLAKLPVLLITPHITDTTHATTLHFKISLWGISQSVLIEEKFLPTGLTYPYHQNQKHYTPADKSHILAELIPQLLAFIAFVADQYYWTFHKTAPILPHLLTTDKFAPSPAPAASVSERSEQVSHPPAVALGASVSEQVSFPPTASVGAAQRSQLPLTTRPATAPVRVGPGVSVPVRVSPCSPAASLTTTATAVPAATFAPSASVSERSEQVSHLPPPPTPAAATAHLRQFYSRAYQTMFEKNVTEDTEENRLRMLTSPEDALTLCENLKPLTSLQAYEKALDSTLQFACSVRGKTSKSDMFFATDVPFIKKLSEQYHRIGKTKKSEDILRYAENAKNHVHSFELERVPLASGKIKSKKVQLETLDLVEDLLKTAHEFASKNELRDLYLCVQKKGTGKIEVHIVDKDINVIIFREQFDFLFEFQTLKNHRQTKELFAGKTYFTVEMKDIETKIHNLKNNEQSVFHY